MSEQHMLPRTSIMLKLWNGLLVWLELQILCFSFFPPFFLASGVWNIVCSIMTRIKIRWSVQGVRHSKTTFYFMFVVKWDSCPSLLNADAAAKHDTFLAGLIIISTDPVCHKYTTYILNIRWVVSFDDTQLFVEL